MECATGIAHCGRIGSLCNAISVSYCVGIVCLDELLESSASIVVADAVDLKRSLRWVLEVEDVS